MKTLIEQHRARDAIQAAAYREIVALLAVTSAPNVADPFVVDVAALIHRTHKEVMKSNTLLRAASTRRE